MKPLLTTLLTLAVVCCFAQRTTIAIKKVKQRYPLTKTCYDYLNWDEVVLVNKTAERAINSIIRAGVMRYKLSKDDAIPRCRGEMEYEPEFKIVFAKQGFISYEFTAYTYFKGAAHGGRQFENMNFDAATGRQIDFQNLIDSNAIATLDSMIIQKMKERLNMQDAVDMEVFRAQLPRLFFAFTDKGIDINFVGDSYWASVVGVSFTYNELRPFAKRDGILKRFYNITR